MKKIVLDGNRFRDLEGFFCEIDRLLTKGIDFPTGHNLNAYDDLLCGGFGVHEYGEPIVIQWVDHLKSKEDLGEELFFRIVEITRDGDHSDHNCILELC